MLFLQPRMPFLAALVNSYLSVKALLKCHILWETFYKNHLSPPITTFPQAAKVLTSPIAVTISYSHFPPMITSHSIRVATGAICHLILSALYRVIPQQALVQMNGIIYLGTSLLNSLVKNADFVELTPAKF